MPTPEPTPEPSPEGEYCGIWVEVKDYCLENNHVGSDWTRNYYASFDGVNYVEVNPSGSWYSVDHPVTLYVESSYKEADDIPDTGVNDYSTELDLTKGSTRSGSSWTITQTTVVTERGGRYAGNTATWEAEWTITFLYNK